MKKLIILTLVVILLGSIYIVGCAEPEETVTPTEPAKPAEPTTPTTPTEPAKPTEPAEPTKPAEPTEPTGPTPPDPGARYGGTYIAISNLPIMSNLGYPREMGSNEPGWWSEALAEKSDLYGNLTPLLAESWEEDYEAKTFTVHLRKGVKFHDGTDFNAEAAKWNYEEKIAGKTFALWQRVTSIDVIDDYTLRFTLSDYPYDVKDIILTEVKFYSPTAIETNGRDWALMNETGTGPFTVVDVQPDVSITMDRFDDYWQEGYPYLDRIIYKTIGDALVAQALMENGEADEWASPSDPTIFVEMEKKGFIARYTGRPLNSLQWFLYPENKPDSIFNDIKIRQAVACALDTEGIALAIGKGIYDPLNQLVYKGLYCYNPDFHDNDYNLDKARQLLEEAGYPDGFETSLTYEPGEKDDAAAIADCLGKVGIEVELNMVNMGSYFQIIMTGWDGLALIFSGVGNDMYGISSFSSWLGPTRSIPFQMRDWSPEVLALLEEGLHTYDEEARKEIAVRLFTAAVKELNVIPVYQRPNAVLYQPWVHSLYPEDGGISERHIYKVWMDEH